MASKGKGKTETKLLEIRSRKDRRGAPDFRRGFSRRICQRSGDTRPEKSANDLVFQQIKEKLDERLAELAPEVDLQDDKKSKRAKTQRQSSIVLVSCVRSISGLNNNGENLQTEPKLEARKAANEDPL